MRFLSSLSAAEAGSLADEEKSQTLQEELLPLHEREDADDGQSESSSFSSSLSSNDQEPRHSSPDHKVSARVTLLFLAWWFVLNLFLTLSNKSILYQASFPWLLTALHTSATWLGCLMISALGWGSADNKSSSLELRENLILLAFSLLFTLNIAVSNISLAMVSVPFHQIARSTCPIATILLYRFFWRRTYSLQTYLTLIPLVVGVAIATVGDYYTTLAGFVLTMLGVVLASVKTIASNQLMTGSLKLSPLDLLMRMAPLATIQCVIFAIVSGEADRIGVAVHEGVFSTPWFIVALAANVCTACVLNLVGMQANKLAGALTMTVCGNIKQAATILLGILLFQVRVGWLNASGMLITFVGAVLYSRVELSNRRN